MGFSEFALEGDPREAPVSVIEGWLLAEVQNEFG